MMIHVENVTILVLGPLTRLGNSLQPYLLVSMYSISDNMRCSSIVLCPILGILVIHVMDVVIKWGL